MHYFLSAFLAALAGILGSAFRLARSALYWFFRSPPIDVGHGDGCRCRWCVDERFDRISM